MNTTTSSKQQINDELNFRIAEISRRSPGHYMNKVSRARYKKNNKEKVARFLSRRRYIGDGLAAFLECGGFNSGHLAIYTTN